MGPQPDTPDLPWPTDTTAAAGIWSPDPARSRQRSEDIQQLQVARLLEGSRSAALVTLLVVPPLAFLLAGSIRAEALIVWAGTLVGLSGIRYLMLTRRRLRGIRDQALSRIKVSVFIWQITVGLAWGSIALLIDSPELQLVTILLPLFAAAVLISLFTCYNWPAAVIGFTVAVAMPVSLRLLIEHRAAEPGALGAAGLLALVILAVTLRMYRQAVRNIELSADNSLLASRIEEVEHKNETIALELRDESFVRGDIELQLRQERNFIAGVLDTENTIVLVMGLDATVRRFNRGCEVCTGYSAHEILGRTVWDFLLPDDQKDFFKSQLEAVTAGFFPTECELQWHSKNQGLRLVQLSNTAVLDSDGKCIYIASTGVDITERRRVENSLSHTKKHFEHFVDGVVDYAIYLLNPAGIIVSWNQGAERISGYPAHEAIGADFSHYFSPDTQLDRHLHAELRIAATDGYYRREGWYLKRDGRRFWATLTISPVRGSRKKISGYSVIINDITVRKTTEDTIRSLLSLTEQLNSCLDLDFMMNALVREAVKLVQAESGYAGLVDTGKILVTPYLHRGARVSPDATLAISDATVSGFVCRTRHICVFNESDNSPRIPSAAGTDQGPRNMICVPIIANNGETLGFIEIHNKSAANDFDADDCKKLVSAANSAALAIQNAKSFRKIKDAEALLSDETVILETIARRQPLHQILQIIVNVVETHCPGVAACIIRRDDRGHPGYIVCSPSLVDTLHPTPELYRRIDEYLGHPDSSVSGFVSAPGLVSPGGPLYAIEQSIRPNHACISPIGNADAVARDILLLLGDSDVLNKAQISTVPGKLRHLARITLERWSSEQDLQIRDQAMSSTMNAILLIDHQNPEFPVIYANTAADSLIQPSAGTLTGRSMTTLLAGVAGKQSSAIEKALHYRQHAYATIEREQADGDSQWIEVYVTPVHDRTNEAQHSIAIMNDITERVTAQRALAQSRETLRSLSDHLQTVREHEKAGLARELHDELGGMLTTLKIDASSIKDQLGRNPDAARSRADAIVDTVHDAIATVRRISTGLRPPVLDSLGLVPAIEWQLDQFEKRTGIAVDRHISEDIRVTDSHHSIAIFRILQEGLTNITRHAQATRISIVLIVDSHLVALDIIDDGVGFVVKTEETGTSYGLYSMQERALALGGRVDILSRPGDGTRLKVRVPLPAVDNPPTGVQS